MPVIAYLSLLVCLCPLLIFFDYHKRSNIYIAIVYVVVFFVVWRFVLFALIDAYGLWFAGAIPFLLAGMLVVKRMLR